MSNDHKAYILLIFTMSFWAGNAVLGRGIHEAIPPIALSWIRWTLASVVILPFAINHLKEDWPEIKNHLGILLFLGIIGVGAFNTLQYTALNYTDALNVLILQSSGPLCIILAGFLIFGDKISRLQILGILISTLGVLVVICKGNLETLLGLKIGLGDALILLGTLFWAIYTIFLRKRPNIHMLSFAATTFIIGALANLPLMIVETIYDRSLRFDQTTVLAVAYVSIFPSVLAYIFYNKAVEYIGPARTSAFIHLIPIIGVIFAIIFLGEKLQFFHIVGFVTILSGIWLTVRKRTNE